MPDRRLPHRARQRAGDPGAHDQLQEKAGGDGQEEVRHRARGRDPEAVPVRVLQISRIHRHRLRPAEAGDEHHQGAERIQVAERIEAHPPQ